VFAQQAPITKPLKVESPDPNLATDAALFASEAARLASPSAEEIEKLKEIKVKKITMPGRLRKWLTIGCRAIYIAARKMRFPYAKPVGRWLLRKLTT